MWFRGVGIKSVRPMETVQGLIATSLEQTTSALDKERTNNLLFVLSSVCLFFRLFV